ncbi:hypothetical protein GCM10010264_74650 [Streptomyces globisporus]|nr:hypothetical protein GCM10010264_74650 [Streptomyces globisporus]
MHRGPALVVQLLGGGQLVVELADDVGGHDPVASGVLCLDRRQGYVEQDGYGRTLPAGRAGQQPGPDGGAEVGGVDDRGVLTELDSTFVQVRRSFC